LLSYSQNAEDVRMWRVLQDVADGFYVDVGAGHPTSGSVTRLFYDHGWTGINIEPGPTFPELADSRARDINVHAAVGPTDGTTELLVTYPDPHLSTVDPEMLRWSEDRIERVESIKVDQRRLETILTEHASGRRIDFLKVDVEGAERAVLESSDWSRFRPRIVVVESIRPWSRESNHQDWEEILTRNGYRYVTFDGINRFYVSDEEGALADELGYPISVLDYFTPPGEQQALERLAALQAEFESLLGRSREWEHLEARLLELQTEIASLRDEAGSATKRATLAETRLRSILGSRAYRAALIGRRLAGPARPVLRPVVRMARRARRAQRRLSDRMRRLGRRIRPRNVAARYREALAPRRPYGFPLPGHPWPAAARRDGALSEIRTLLDGDRRAATPEAVASAVAATQRHEESVIFGRSLVPAERDAVLAAEVLGVLRASPRQDPSSGKEPARGSRVVVDARCLQDPAYRLRGVGRHSEHVLRTVAALAAGRSEIVLLIDPALPVLDADLAAIGNRCVAAVDPADVGGTAALIELSPMTADPGPLLPLLLARHVRRAAIVYDFIPNQHSEIYLGADEHRISYLGRLEALDRYDSFLAISAFTASELPAILGRDVEVTVTGVADPLDASIHAADAGVMFSRYVLVASGADARKNLPAAIAAHTVYSGPRSRRMGLVVVGAFPGDLLQAAREFAAECRIPAKRIAFVSGVSDEQLRSLYAGADVVVVPSLTEGFSIPVVEAISSGTPVVASDIPAHEELLGAGSWLAPPADPVALGRCVSRALRDPKGLWEAQRAAIGDRFSPRTVTQRIEEALEPLLPRESSPAHESHRSRRSGRPRLAVVTPLPPQQTGIAEYSAVTFRAVADHADLVFYTDRRGAVAPHPAIELRPYSIEPYVGRDFDAVVSVLGNSHFHIPVLDYFLELGGAAIAHDPRMAELYHFWRGPEHLAHLLSRHSDEPVLAPDVPGLLAHPDRLPATVYDEIAPRGRPLLVHGAGIARRILAETGIKPVALPYVPHRLPRVESVTPGLTASSRRALGWDDRSLHVVSFGIVDRRTKATEVIVDAIAWLRTWGIDCRLHFVGAAAGGERDELLARAAGLGIAPFVDITGWVSLEGLETNLLAADAAVQLRTFALAPMSGAMLDCMSFGVPTLATESLKAEMESPGYVYTVADRFSGLLLAEALAPVLARPRTSSVIAIEPQRREWLAERNPGVYARRLLEALGLGVDA
jgi:FkbM family methyltransferase